MVWSSFLPDAEHTGKSQEITTNDWAYKTILADSLKEQTWTIHKPSHQYY